MFQQILDILKPPQVIQPGAVQEQTDYSIAIIGSVALIVVAVVIFLILKKK